MAPINVLANGFSTHCKNEIWDSYGHSARLPSALGSLFLMLIIKRYSCIAGLRKGDRKIFAPIIASLSFALSPFIVIWSRTAVSDALFTGTIGISLLLFWRRMASKNSDQMHFSVAIFGIFAILTKDLLHLILATLTITFFLFSQKDWKILLFKINPKVFNNVLSVFRGISWN